MKDQIIFHCHETVLMGLVETSSRKISWDPPVEVEAGKSYLIEIDDGRLLIQEVDFVKTLVDVSLKKAKSEKIQ